MGHPTRCSPVQRRHAHTMYASSTNSLTVLHHMSHPLLQMLGEWYHRARIPLPSSIALDDHTAVDSLVGAGAIVSAHRLLAACRTLTPHSPHPV
jgi:hypothetical protein